MVHGLATLEKLNAAAARKPAAHKNGNGIPKELHGNPVAIRNFLNRPWTKAELRGKRSVFETYAESDSGTARMEGIRH